ncbi:ATP-grasp domain-containing protein [Rhizobium laguerreae]|uniref:ATP-grasp domain-containing protein n=1 Tax=Rhizobium laguerreae TaxID=1076926 RepID=UPI001C900CB7|nr:ATP-grasp domain-containing protein [Rhizobium laguerreae]MBY3155495.1 ATP-grasp domain-containing protein [Rhizobium laguerreae]
MTVFALQNNSLDRIGRLVMPCVDYCNRRGLAFVDRSLTVDLDVDTLDIDDTRGLLVYGSVGWAKRFRDSRYGRWIDYDEDAFATSTWSPVLGGRALNGRGELMTVQEVTRRLASGGRLHLRPDRNDKAFGGGLFDAASWSGMLAEKKSSMGVVLDETVCWASVPKAIDEEIRCWFVGGELVEASRYRKDGALVIERVDDPGVMRAASELGGWYLPRDNAVMDIAIQGGDTFVVEYNKIHSAGWYSADVDRVLDAWVADLEVRAVSGPGIPLSTASL